MLEIPKDLNQHFKCWEGVKGGRYYLVDTMERFKEFILRAVKQPALAVDTERGLLVPVIRDADQLDLVSIQNEGDTLIQRALAGESLPDDLSGGTFTLTNLGMFEIDGFTPSSRCRRPRTDPYIPVP